MKEEESEEKTRYLNSKGREMAPIFVEREEGTGRLWDLLT